MQKTINRIGIVLVLLSFILFLISLVYWYTFAINVTVMFVGLYMSFYRKECYDIDNLEKNNKIYHDKAALDRGMDYNMSLYKF